MFTHFFTRTWILLLFCAAFPLLLPAQTFFEQLPGPEGGKVYAIVCSSQGHPVCCTQTRMYQWDAATPAWTKRFEFWIDVNSKKMLRAADGRLYASAVTARLLVSEDDGATWEKVPSLGTYSRDIAENAAGVLFNAANGVMMSTDDGESWIERSSGLEDEYLHAITCLSNGDLVVAAPQTTLFHSTDDGLHWSALAGAPSGIYDLFTASDGMLYAAGSEGVFISTDNGIHWSLSEAPGSVTAIAEAPNGDLFICTTNARTGIHRSTDHGSTWTETDAVTDRITGNGIAFSDDGTGYCATSIGVLVWSASAERWEWMNTGLTAATVMAALGTGDGDMLVSVSGDAPYRSTDRGQTWSRCTEANDLLYVHTLTERNSAVYAVSRDWLHRSTDAGEHWVPMNPKDRFETGEGLVFDMQGNIFVARRGGVAVSTDDGNTWQTRGEGLPESLSPAAFTRGGDGSLYIAISSEGVFRSTDAGFEWEKLSTLPVEARPSCLLVAEDNTLYVGTSGKAVYRSSDGGQQWEQLIDGLNNRHVQAILSAPSGTVYCATNTGVFFLIEDRATWAYLHGFGYRTNDLAVDAHGAIIVGSDGNGVFRSITSLPTTPPSAPQLLLPADNAENVGSNPGFQWELPADAAAYRFQLAKDAAMLQPITDTVVDAYGQLTLHNLDRPGKYFWRVAGLNDAGHGNWSATRSFNTGAVSTVQSADRVPVRLETSYPQPCSGITRVAFSLAALSHVRITVHSTLGRRMATLLSGTLPAGRHQVLWDASRVPCGMYLCTLQTASGHVDRRMILVSR